MEGMVRRYFSLWQCFFNNSLTRDMEFKANFLAGVLVDAVFYGIHYFFFSVIYSYVDALGDFSREDVIIFLIVTFLADTVYMLFFSGNLFNLNRIAVKGELDFYLLKPVHSQFLVSMRYVKSYAFVSLFILGAMLINLVGQYSVDIPFQNWLYFLFSFGMGALLWYSVDFIIVCSTFWFRNFSVGGWLSHEVLKFSTRPDSIYTGLLRKTLFTFVPMAFISSVPTRFLLYGLNLKYFTLQVGLTLTFMILSRFVWKRGLKRYESASS
jgi:ABC-2 type transport system permease protein